MAKNRKTFANPIQTDQNYKEWVLPRDRQQITFIMSNGFCPLSKNSPTPTPCWMSIPTPSPLDGYTNQN